MIFNILICVLGIISIPFVYPVAANILIKLNIFKDIYQLKEYMLVFKYFNLLIIVILGTILLYTSNVSIGDFIKNIFSKININIKKGDAELSLTSNNEFQKDEAIRMSMDAKKEARIVLENDSIVNKKQCDNCKEEIVNERESLRYFATYQITNKYTIELLKLIKVNERVTVSDFKLNMLNYYGRTTNMGKKKKKEKIENLLHNLKYLNIIEYTEDDKYIILTQNGKEFMSSNYVEEVG